MNPDHKERINAVTGSDILVVDDNVNNLKLLEGILINAGYRVRLASDGELALRSAMAHTPSLVLMDIRMPGMDGYEACRRLKEDEGTREVPVIFISILEDEGDKVKGFQAGAADYINKPFQPAEVLARIKNQLRLKELTEKLEQKIHERTEKLILANKHLQQEITERRLAEEEIITLNRELEKRVIARTQQLEATNRELEAFAYSISHDLRAPLRHINGFVSLLEESAGQVLDEQSRHYMNTISKSAIKMGILIDNLLNFSRMGSQEMFFKEVNTGDLIREVIDDFASECKEREIVWKIADLPPVEGDRSMLKIVLTNLVSNAVKFTRTRDRAVIEAGGQKQEDEVVVYIRDNGVGFDPDYTEKLFGVFHRLHGSDEFEGTGVGLAIAQRIILRHGGRMWAEGEPERGAAFYFSLPLNRERVS